MAIPDELDAARVEYAEIAVHHDGQNLSMKEVESRLESTHAGDAHNPLHWPLWLKITILVQTSVLAALGGLNTATINPALNQIAREFHLDVVRASYQTTVCIALNGIAPFIWIPLAHRYGRRPVWLATTLLGFVSILSCAYTKTFEQLLLARVFNGLFPVGFALGVATVVDLFPYHQRGRAMGFFTVTVANGSHIAPIIGGLLGQYCGWRWIFKFLAICDGVALIIAGFCLPETIHTISLTGTTLLTPTQSSITRSPSPALHDQPLHVPVQRPRYKSIMALYTLNRTASLSPTSFLIPTLKLFLNPHAAFPATYYAAMYGFASILPAVTAAAIFTTFFHWNTLTIGLTYGGVLTVGGILGEICAGPVCDWIVCRAAARNDLSINTSPNANTPISEHSSSPSTPISHIKPKSTPPHPQLNEIQSTLRLLPIYPGVLITTTGLLLYGFTLQYRTHPSVPLVGMSLSSFGLQIITTTTYTYAVDCLPRPSPGREGTATNATAELAQLFNLIRQGFGMTFAFYVVRLGDRIGFQWTFLVFAGLGGVAFLPVWGLLRGYIGRGGGGRVKIKGGKDREKGI